MIKILALSAALVGCLANSATKESNSAPAAVQQNIAAKSIYDFKVDGLEGGSIDFAAFKGKKILIVNTASKCGYTPQYKGLQELYDKYKDHLVIVGFPANNFFSQE